MTTQNHSPVTLDAVKKQKRFVLWMSVGCGNGPPRKVPTDLDGDLFQGETLAPGVRGSGTYRQAVRAFKKLSAKNAAYAGVGVIFGERNGIRLGGIDLDEVLEPKTEELHPVADELIEKADT